MIRKVLVCGRELEVAFDYDKGEPQWFDALKGVGSPGYPPSITVLGFRDQLEYTSMEDIEQAIIDILVAEESERGNEP